MNIFALAEYQVQTRNKIPVTRKDYLSKVIDTAIAIRHYLDMQIRNKKVAIARYKK